MSSVREDTIRFMSYTAPHEGKSENYNKFLKIGGILGLLAMAVVTTVGIGLVQNGCPAAGYAVIGVAAAGGIIGGGCYLRLEYKRLKAGMQLLEEMKKQDWTQECKAIEGTDARAKLIARDGHHVVLVRTSRYSADRDERYTVAVFVSQKDAQEFQIKENSKFY